MKQWLLIGIASLAVIGCATVAGTDRRQLRLIPSSELLAMSFQQYDQFLAENPVSEDAAATAMVQEVGQRLARTVDGYLREIGRVREADSYAWEFQLIESDVANAWAMPGGKIAVYTGILPLTRDETGLAVVLAHEIAHVVAEHGNERMSQALIAQLGGAALLSALREQPERTRELWLIAYGAGAQLGVLLPYSRLHETEADRLGLMFMAMAGYDPRAAIDFWERMAAMKQGVSPPQFASTHPSDANRIRDIREFMPQALEYYRP